MDADLSDMLTVYYIARNPNEIILITTTVDR